MRVTVIGAGYVGLVTGACLAAVGHRVVCVDVQARRVEAINAGAAPFREPGLDRLIREGLRNKRFQAMTDLGRAMAGSQVSIIAVGTPPRGEDVDLGQVAAAARAVGRCLRLAARYHVVVVKSTVPPGTTGSLVRRALEEASGLRVGAFGICMNPEFLREGSAVADFLRPDRIVVGQWDDRSGRQLLRLYERFACPKLRTGLRNAELIKYAANSLLATLISFSNEVARLCEATPGTDVETVMEGVHLDRRLSPLLDGRRMRPEILAYLRAGVGFGGSCLPKDVDALRAFAGRRGAETPLLDAVAMVNARRPGQVVKMLEDVLGGLRGRVIAVLGLAFKPGTDDVRASPALAMVDLLLAGGATVRAHDPVALDGARRLLDGRVALCADPAAALAGADAALIATAWPQFARLDWPALAARMRRPVIVDGRNGLGRVKWPAGVIYRTVGRGYRSEEVPRRQSTAEDDHA